jgi:hypothetical protein
MLGIFTSSHRSTSRVVPSSPVRSLWWSASGGDPGSNVNTRTEGHDLIAAHVLATGMDQQRGFLDSRPQW